MWPKRSIAPPAPIGGGAMKAEQTDPRLERAVQVVLNSQRTLPNPLPEAMFEALKPIILKDARALLAVIDGAAPDWADIRESARKAGWTRRQLARDWWFWTDKGSSVHLRKRWDGGWKITLAGDFGDLVLNEPTPARFLAIAREVGLGGAS